MGWVWPGILIPIALFFFGIIVLSGVISGQALENKNK